MRNCSKCGTEFKERFGQDFVDPIDPIEECYKDNKENGICVNCCRCNK